MKRPGEVSARGAAKVLKVHERTVRRWCKSGRLATARHDGLTNRYFVAETEVIELRACGKWAVAQDDDT